MAGLNAINAVTGGLAQYLTRAHQLSPIKNTSCKFAAVGTSEFALLKGDDTTVSILVYRISANEHTRNVLGRPDPMRPSMTVDVHMLLSVWTDTALKEQLLFAWVMRELARLGTLDRGVLGSTSGFDLGDLVQLATEDLSLEDVTKLWHNLAPPFRLSMGLQARNVRIDYEDDESFAPVVATRLEFSDTEGD